MWCSSLLALLPIVIAALHQEAPGSGTAILVLAVLMAAFTGTLVWKLPWRRWFLFHSHSIAIISLGLIAFSAWAGEDSSLYSSFYIAVFICIGLLYKRGTSLRFLPLLVFAYTLPVLLRGESLGTFAGPFIYTVALCLTIGEAIAWLREKLSRPEEEATEREFFSSVSARSSTTSPISSQLLTSTPA